MKVLIFLLTIVVVSFVLFPEEYYRISDLASSDKSTFTPFSINKIDFDTENIFVQEFQIERSGYYEVGLLFESPTKEIIEIEDQFRGAMIIEIFTNEGEMVESKKIHRTMFFKPFESDLEFANEVVFSVFSLNAIRYGEEYRIRIKTDNEFLLHTKANLFLAISGYY